MIPRQRWRTDKERRALVAEMYGYTGSVREVAWSLRMRYSDVAADLDLWRREHPGQNARQTGKRLLHRDQRAAEATRLRSDGLTIREIAARQHVSRETVRRDLARADSVSRIDTKARHIGTPGSADVTGECVTPPQAQVILLRGRTA